jgi:hypothetical protein
MVVGLPFVALAVSAGCWYAAPAGDAVPAGDAMPAVAVVAVAPWSGSAGSAIAPPHAADAVAPVVYGVAPAAAPAIGDLLVSAPVAVPAGVPADPPVPAGRLCRLVTGERAPPRTV